MTLLRPWVAGSIPVVVALLAWWWRRGRSLAVTAGTPSAGGPRWGRIDADLLLRAALVAVLLLVLAGPARVRPQAGAPAAEAVMVVVDVSESMREAADGGASRLERGLVRLERFLAARPGSAVGVVAFGRRIVTLAPPTTDRSVLAAALAEARHLDLGDATALGSAIGVAANRLRAVGAPQRLMVVITDGEHNAGPLDPVTAARAAAALGIRVHTVAAGPDPDGTLVRVARAGAGVSGEGEGAWEALAAREAPPAPVGAAVRAATGPFLWLAMMLLLLEGVARSGRRRVLP